MKTPATEQPSSAGVLEKLRAALSNGDHLKADRILSELPEKSPPALQETVGLVHLAQQRWSKAAECLGAVRAATGQIEALLRYAGNMSALQTNQPEAYESILAAPETGRYEVDTAGAGLPTIMQRLGGDRWRPVIVGANPEQHVASALRLMESSYSSAVCFGLAGIGDGHVLSQFLDQWPADPLGVEAPLFVLEPDPELVRAVLLLHDLSQPDGPIRSERVRWCVGSAWERQLETVLREDPYLPPPSKLIQLTPAGEGIAQRAHQINGVADGEDQEYRDAFVEYATRSDETWTEIFRGQAGRLPRVLLMTSRFTSVLQHATQDSAAALERLGWQTRILIEPAPYKRVTTRVLRLLIGEYRPDLVLVIDHLRGTLPSVFPVELPFACWLQDDLTHLTRPEAGRTVGPRDFVLTCAPELYADEFEYPRDQCIYADKFTRSPDVPATWTQDSLDMVFVSHASKDPHQIVKQILASAGQDDHLRTMVDLSCRRIMGVYRQDRSITAPTEVRELVDRACSETGYATLPRPARASLTLRLFNSLNNTLYRQQAIRWAISAAEQLDLTLGLYGSGWEDNPEFARYANGQVAYGPDLERLTRSAKINLQIVPFSCLHQRLLDGLVAGGFFLIREHPFDRLHERMSRFVLGLPEGIDSVEGASGHLTADSNNELTQILAERCSILLDAGKDPIEAYRRHRDTGAEYIYETLPLWEQVTFNDAASFTDRVQQFLNAPDRRTSIAAEQRRFVERTRTYEAGLSRVLNQITYLLGQEQREISVAG